jgi:Carboxypeptidase regulatory-like domain
MKFFSVLLAVAMFSAAAAGQDINATLRGIVTDTSGAVIRKATVEVTNTEKGISRTILTDDNGEYDVPQLAPQTYSIIVTAPGFKTQVRNQYTLQTAQEARLNFKLTVGESTQEVVVNANASLLQTEDIGASEVIDEKKVEELPQNGRNVFYLALLAANVYAPIGSTTYSVAGNPSVNNNYLLDGVQNNDRTTGSPTLKPSEDGIQEFRILTGQYAAEYGRQSGGQVIMTSKSGDNNFHGTAYDYVRDNVTDARNFFSTTELPPFTQNQFGASVGGPIKKNHTFFFGTYEGLRQTKDAVSVSTVPTDLERSGDFSQLVTTANPNPITINGTPTTTVPVNLITPTSEALLQYVPAPNTGNGLSNNYTFNSVSSQNYDQFSVRADQVLTPKDTFFSTYQFYNSYTVTAGSLPLFGSTAPARDQVISVAEDHSFTPHLINEARIGYNRWVALNISQANSLGDVISKVGIPQGGTNGLAPTTPATGGVPYVTLTGYATFGTASNLPQSRWDNTFNYVDSLTWDLGKHTFKTGFDIEHFYKHSFFVTDNTGAFTFNGQFTGNAFADYLIGGLRTTQFALGDPNQHPYTNAASFYGQDQWKVSPNLTLDLGVRYELFTPQKERNNKLGTFDTTDGTLLDGQGDRYSVNPATGNLLKVGSANLGDTLYNQPHLNFAPRVGFDYRLFNDTAVIRGGYGIYYDQLVVGNGEYQNYGLGPPYILIKSYTNQVGAAPATWNDPFPTGVSGGSISPYGINENLPTPYRQQWSLGVQKEVIKNFLVEVSYLGSNGSHLPLRYNINQPTPGPGAIQGRRPYDLWSTVTWLNDVGTSSYNALTLRAERRYANGFSFLTSLNYAKSLDQGTTASSGTSPQNPLDLRAEWGPSSYDARLRYIATFVDELPFGKGRRFLADSNPVIRSIVGGWEATAILTLQTGNPFNVTSSKDISNTGAANRPFQIGNPAAGAPHTLKEWFNTAAFTTANPAGAGIYAYGNTRRDNVRGPGVENTDVGVFRSFRITERVHTQIRAEAFNALNHPSFSNPSSDANSPATFGVISSTASTARQLQFAGKVIF